MKRQLFFFAKKMKLEEEGCGVRMRNHVKNMVLFLACFVFFLFLMLCIPYSSDDFEFARQEFSSSFELIRYVLYYGNGRFLGNLGAICLVKAPIVAAVVKALLISSVIFLVPITIGKARLWIFMLSFALFVSIPDTLFGEVYTWTCGFQNYIPPIYCTLLVIILLQKLESNCSELVKIVCLCGIFALGIASQLFVEHSTLINVVLSGAWMVVSKKAGKKTSPPILWFCGTMLGLLIMCLIPFVFQLEGNRSEGYRSVNLGSVVQLAESCIRSFAAIGSAIPVGGSVLVTVITMITAGMTQENRKKHINNWIYTICMADMMYLLLNDLLLDNAWYGRMATLRTAVTACCSVVPFCLWAIVLAPLEDRVLRNKIYVLFTLAMISVIPLLVVSPTPDRVIFQAYVFVVMSILLFADTIISKVPIWFLTFGKRGLASASVCMILLLCLAFGNIHWLKNMRETYIRQEMEKQATEIAIFRIPYDYVFWDGTWCFGRGYYYQEWDDITFVCLDYHDWYSRCWLKSDT